jgi:predicted PurR-regulated permease PerM
VALVHQAVSNGPMPMPPWLARVPGIGGWLQEQWSAVLGGGGSDLQWMESAKAKGFEWTRVIGLQIVRRMVTLGFALLTLFFVYWRGLELEDDVRQLSQKLFGAGVVPLIDRAVAAIRATVDGIVLVAVGEGALMAAAYALAGVPHPVLLGAITGVFAMIPFAAPLAFGAVALVLAMQGSMGAAIGILIFGGLLLFFVDHFLRPVIIGGAARLPFLWVLLGILGGVESFGLVGLFVGPALMAALCSLWRDWTVKAG